MDQGQASSGVAAAARKKPGGPRFELVKEIRHGVWIAVRPGDPRGEQYLARPVEDFMKLRKGSDTAAWEKLRDEHNQAHVVAQILNHENLVSLVGRIDSRPFSKIQKNPKTHTKDDKIDSYLVWDYCDAANLSALFKEHPCKDSSYYLPESLCWHVLRALTRAVTYLHDGKRLHFDAGLLPGASRAWRTVDADWLSILHRAIEPANIYFQHPRGTETYGQCKLANFSKAAVTSHVANVKKKLGAKPSGMSMARYRGNEPLIETMGKYFREPKDDSMEDDSVEDYPLEDSSVDERPYTLMQELWSIGAVIFTMMTGKAPAFSCKKCGCCHIRYCQAEGCLENAAFRDGCNCLLGGCEHIGKEDCNEPYTVWKACPPHHICEEPIINIHTYLARAKYTTMLRSAIKELIMYDPKQKNLHAAVALNHAKHVEAYYQDWKKQTEEGKEYRDLEDDMAERWVVANP